MRRPFYHRGVLRRYIKRRAREGFEESASVTDPSAIKSLLAAGKQELEVAKRQSLVYQLYGRKYKNVLVGDRSGLCRRGDRKRGMFGRGCGMSGPAWVEGYPLSDLARRAPEGTGACPLQRSPHLSNVTCMACTTII